MTLDEAGALLAGAPAPSPWYLAGARAIDSRHGPLKWRKADVNLALVDRARHTYGLLGMYCFAVAIAPRTLLVWYDSGGVVTFHVVAVDQLEPLASIPKAAEALGADGRGWITRDDTAPALTLRDADAGRIAAPIPEPLSAVEEILFFVRSGRVRLWVLQPKARRLEVIPQDWFNDGAFDRDFCWPTRVARDAATRRFVVDGIRIGVYLLDAAGRGIAESLAGAAR